MIQKYLEWAINRGMKPEDLEIYQKQNGDYILYDKRDFIFTSLIDKLKEIKT